jgi:hypothetical protein
MIDERKRTYESSDSMNEGEKRLKPGKLMTRMSIKISFALYIYVYIYVYIYTYIYVHTYMYMQSLHRYLKIFIKSE